MIPPAEHPHQGIIKNLIEIANYLYSSPGLPVPGDVELVWRMAGTDSERVAKVREVGHSWNAELAWNAAGTEAFVYWPLADLTWTMLAQVGAAPAGSIAASEELARLESAGTCADCRGSGQQRDGSPCADCKGSGLRADAEALQEVDCIVCSGTGRERGMAAGNSCITCLGKGKVGLWRAPVQMAASWWAGTNW